MDDATVDLKVILKFYQSKDCNYKFILDLKEYSYEIREWFIDVLVENNVSDDRICLQHWQIHWFMQINFDRQLAMCRFWSI